MIVVINNRIEMIKKGKFHLSDKYSSFLLSDDAKIDKIKKNDDRVGIETNRKINNLKYKLPFSFENIFLNKIIKIFNTKIQYILQFSSNHYYLYELSRKHLHI